jgi:hypothetical protein
MRAGTPEVLEENQGGFLTLKWAMVTQTAGQECGKEIIMKNLCSGES